MRTLSLAILIVLLFIGCSNHGTSVVSNIQKYPDMTEHALLGTWTVDFDLETLVPQISQCRKSSTHISALNFIPPPQITINSFDPTTNVADIDITLHNPTWTSVHDVRLIIFTDDTDCKLLNGDNWTSLWNIPGGQIANPFKAFAKYEPNRIFTGENWHQENFQIEFPNRNFNVQFAVDASYMGNCEEPYEIKDFTQGILSDDVGESTEIEITVHDWQNDVDTVTLFCPGIIGQNPLSLTEINEEKWGMTLVNNTGATIGEYAGYIIATSANSGSLNLYDIVTITIGNLWGDAIPVALQDTMSGYLELNDEDWFIFYCPPNGINIGSIDVTNGIVEMILYGSDPGESSPGEEIANSNHIIINNDLDSRYYIQIISTSEQTDYELVIKIVPKISEVECSIYVATDDGTEDGTWPIREGWNEELTIEIINNMMIWCNDIWNKYSYNLVWDGTVTIMSAEYYNVVWPEDEEMHNEYGRGTDKLSLYFVQSGWTAYTIPRYPESEQSVNNVFSVYSPNIWYLECVIAHEHGHVIGYLVDQYLYDMTPCECGDYVCLEQHVGDEALYMYSCPDACYEGNLMWYGDFGIPSSEWDLTIRSQVQRVNRFHFENSSNFPWY